MKANDGDLMDEPCEIGMRTMLIESGLVHTFRLRCADSHQFLRITKTQKDRAALCHAFCRTEEIENDGTLLMLGAEVLEAARNNRLAIMKKQK